MNSSNSLNLDDLLNDDTKAQSLVNTLTSQLKISQDSTNPNTNTAATIVNNLLQEIDSQKTKTAVSVLQEICAKSRLDTPVYEVVSTTGNAHEPIFNLKATIGDLVVTSQGNSKKKAKQSAALNMISLLNQLGKNNSIVQQIEKINQSKSSSSNRANQNRQARSSDKREKSKNNDLTKVASQIQLEQISLEPDDKDSNPIGDLIEITQKFSINPPKYEFDESEGPAHSRVFVCHVKFGDFKEPGYGKSKKLAKRQAALKMIESLKSFSYLNQDFSANNANINNSNGNGTNNNTSNSNGTNGVSKPNRPNNRGAKFNIFNSFTKLKMSTKTKIKNLLDTNVNIDTYLLNKQYFESLAEEENIEFKYHAVPCKNKDGKQKTQFTFLDFRLRHDFHYIVH